MCPHTAIYVSSYCYICVLILRYMCPHTATRVLILYPYVSSYSHATRCLAICVLIPLYMCPNTAIYVSSYSRATRRLAIYVSPYPCICVLILLYTCPHTLSVCVLILSCHAPPFLVQKYKYCTRCLFPELSQCGLIGADAQFTCFTGTKVQILTLRAAFSLSFSEIAEQRGRKGRIH
jgi:hypothetical protein